MQKLLELEFVAFEWTAFWLLNIFLGGEYWHFAGCWIHYIIHEFGGPESDNTIFLRVCCLSTLCLGDELVRFSKTAQIFELIKFESKYLDISNCIFRMNSSSEKNICLFFRGGLHLHEEKFHPCSWKLLHTSHIWKCWLILETCASYQCTVSISFQLMMISHTVYT